MSSLCKLTLAVKAKFDARQLEGLVLMVGENFDEDADSGKGKVFLERKLKEKVQEAVYSRRRMEIHKAKAVHNPDPPILRSSMPFRAPPM